MSDEKMNPLEIILTTTVLKEALDQIAIANRGRHTQCTGLTKASIQNRFKDKVHESVYQELDPFRVAEETLSDIKLQKDINFLEVVLCKAAYELSISKTWSYLEGLLRVEEENLKQEKEMICKHRRNALTFEGCKKKMGKKFTKFDVKLRLVDEVLADVKNDLKNIAQINGMEVSLVQKWEQTRFDQAQLLHDKDEKELCKQRKLFVHKIESEQRLIHDIEAYNNIQIKDYEDQIDFWERKYTLELAELNEKIKNLSSAIFEVCKKHERHQDIWTKRQEYIDEYKERKERERREYEIEQNRINSAIKIQAWWRGVMVRRHLGPYRRKKKGKKGGKKGK